MKLLILLLSLMLSTTAHAIIVVGTGGSGGGGGGCTTQAEDVSFTTTNVHSLFDYNYEERGQSWKAGASADGKKLYSIQFRRDTTDYTTATLTYRIGTSSNLSSTYLVEGTCDVPDAVGFFECVINASDRPTLTSGTTYYILMRTSALWYISRDTSGTGGAGTYADGTAFYDTTKNWTGTTHVADLPFKTKYCVD